MRRKSGHHLAPALFAVMFVPMSASALQVSLSPRDLFEAADLVVVAETTSVETRWAAGADGHIERVAFLAPLHWYKNTAQTPTVEILLPGGTIGEFGTWVEDVPNLSTDQPYLLFLRQSEGGHWRVFGGEQGAIPLDMGEGTRGAPLDFLEAEMGVK